MILGLDHVQVAIPAGGEDAARAFYGSLLGMTEVPSRPRWPSGAAAGSPPAARCCTSASRSRSSRRARHIRLFWSTSWTPLFEALTGAGYDCVRADGEIPGVRRFHTFDPFGNRIEFQQA